MLALPEELRDEFKEPFGPVYGDAESLLAESGRPVIAVGDVVTYHLRVAGRDPDVSVLDGKTKRDAVSEEIAAVLDDENARVEVENEPATLSREMLEALRDAIDREDRVVIHVTGEEDLATPPAIVVAPEGASVVYGQPNEGMVLVPVTAETKAEARDLMKRMDGDADAAFEILTRRD